MLLTMLTMLTMVRWLGCVEMYRWTRLWFVITGTKHLDDIYVHRPSFVCVDVSEHAFWNSPLQLAWMKIFIWFDLVLYIFFTDWRKGRGILWRFIRIGGNSFATQWRCESRRQIIHSWTLSGNLSGDRRSENRIMIERPRIDPLADADWSITRWKSKWSQAIGNECPAGSLQNRSINYCWFNVIGHPHNMDLRDTSTRIQWNIDDVSWYPLCVNPLIRSVVGAMTMWK